MLPAHIASSDNSAWCTISRYCSWNLCDIECAVDFPFHQSPLIVKHLWAIHLPHAAGGHLSNIFYDLDDLSLFFNSSAYFYFTFIPSVVAIRNEGVAIIYNASFFHF